MPRNLLKSDLTNIVILMQITINGVPGPAQNSQHALPKDNIEILIFILVQHIKAIKYGIHTSLLTHKNTIINIIAVRQSRMLINIHINGNDIKYQIHFKNLLYLFGVLRILILANSWRNM